MNFDRRECRYYRGADRDGEKCMCGLPDYLVDKAANNLFRHIDQEASKRYTRHWRNTMRKAYQEKGYFLRYTGNDACDAIRVIQVTNLGNTL